MPFHKLKIAGLVFALLIAHFARAEEKAEEGKAEPKKEDKAALAPMPKQEREFIEKSSRLTTLTNRIANWERIFKEQVREKSLAKTSGEKQRWIKAMVETANERNKDVDTYNKLKTELSLRYPNQGEHINRRYTTQQKRSIEELEGVAGLDEMLTRTKKVIEKKFAPLEDKEEKATAVPVAKPAASEEKPKLRLEK